MSWVYRPPHFRTRRGSPSAFTFPGIIEIVGATSGVGTPSGNSDHIQSIIGTTSGVGTPTGSIGNIVVLAGAVSGLGTPVGLLSNITYLHGIARGFGRIGRKVLIADSFSRVSASGPGDADGGTDPVKAYSIVDGSSSDVSADGSALVLSPDTGVWTGLVGTDTDADIEQYIKVTNFGTPSAINKEISFIFRYADANNYYIARWINDVDATDNSFKLQLIRVNAGVPTVITQETGWARDDSFEMRAIVQTLDPDNIRVRLKYWTGTEGNWDSFHALTLGAITSVLPMLSGRFGIRMNNASASDMHIEDYTVEAMSPVDPLVNLISIEGLVSGSGLVIGDIAIVKVLTGAVFGVGSLAGDLSNVAVLVGATSGIGTPSGALSQIFSLTGTALGTGSTAGNLVRLMTLEGAVLAGGTAQGALAQRLALQGLASGSGTPAGALAQIIALNGAAAGLATVVGDILILGAVNQVDIVGAALGQATVAGLLSNITVLQGSVSGIGSAQADIVKLVQLEGSAFGNANVNAAVSVIQSLEGHADGVGLTQGSLAAIIALDGQVLGIGILVGTLTDAVIIPVVTCPTGVFIHFSETGLLILSSQNEVSPDASGVAPLFGGETGTELICLTEEEEAFING